MSTMAGAGWFGPLSEELAGSGAETRLETSHGLGGATGRRGASDAAGSSCRGNVSADLPMETTSGASLIERSDVEEPRRPALPDQAKETARPPNMMSGKKTLGSRLRRKYISGLCRKRWGRFPKRSNLR